jgi:site-specific DNA-methyltransferase (adenine-specific)
LSDGGFGRSARPIYQLFVDQAKKLQPRFYNNDLFLHDGFAGGKV